MFVSWTVGVGGGWVRGSDIAGSLGRCQVTKARVRAGEGNPYPLGLGGTGEDDPLVLG